MAERQISVSGKGTFQGGRGDVNGAAIEEGMGNGFNALAFGCVEVIVQIIVGVGYQDIVGIVRVDQTGVEGRVLVGGQSEDVGIGARPQPAAWRHERWRYGRKDDG